MTFEEERRIAERQDRFFAERGWIKVREAMWRKPSPTETKQQPHSERESDR